MEPDWTVEGDVLTVRGTGPMRDYLDPPPWSSFSTTIRQLVVGEGITELGASSFSYCPELTSITLSDTVTSIKSEAFVGCRIKSYTLPETVTSIDDSVFMFCRVLSSITISCPIISIPHSTFLGCSELTSVSLPDSITIIGRSAFTDCYHLASITIPNSVTSIEVSAFSSCSSLTSITFSDSLTSIGNDAFSFCESLTSINLPNSLTSIGNNAFFDCNSLPYLYIPDSVTSIGIGIPSKILKLAVFGCDGVGRNSLSNYMSKRRFFEKFDHTDLYDAFLSHNGAAYSLSIYNNVGLINNWNTKIDGFLIVYAIDNIDSFKKLESFFQKIRNISGSNSPIVLCGNKRDLNDSRQVPFNDGERFASLWNCPFFESLIIHFIFLASAKTGEFVFEAFKALVNLIMDSQLQVDKKKICVLM